MPLFLADPLIPKEAWQIVKSQLDTDNKAVSYLLLVDYLRAAITFTTANMLLALELTVNQVLLLSDFELMSYHHRILERDFLILNTS